ncbi:MAG: TetR/AcrR family transcriptional regulator [Rikenellaceae bacterium]
MRNKSKRIYAESLLRLLEKSPYELITISEICDHTSLTRRTFYNNFTSKEEVAEVICEELMDGYIEQIHRSGEFTLLGMSREFYDYGAKNSESFMTLHKSGIFHIFSRVFISRLGYINSLVPNNILSRVDAVQQNYTFLFHSAGVLKIFEEWLISGMNESSAELSEIYTSIVRDVQS